VYEALEHAVSHSDVAACASAPHSMPFPMHADLHSELEIVVPLEDVVPPDELPPDEVLPEELPPEELLPEDDVEPPGPSPFVVEVHATSKSAKTSVDFITGRLPC
jgi:hypothetical protein